MRERTPLTNRLTAVAVAAAAITAIVASGCGGDSEEPAREATQGSHTTTETAIGAQPRSDRSADSGSQADRRQRDRTHTSGAGRGASGNGPSVTSTGDRPPNGAGSAVAGRTAEQQVARVVEGMYSDLAAGDANSVCAAMTADAREQVAQDVPGGSSKPPAQRTCRESMAKFLGAAAGSGVLERTLGATVERVVIAGPIATATVAFRGGSGDIQLRRENGRWRFGTNLVAPRS